MGLENRFWGALRPRNRYILSRATPVVRKGLGSCSQQLPSFAPSQGRRAARLDRGADEKGETLRVPMSFRRPCICPALFEHDFEATLQWLVLDWPAFSASHIRQIVLLPIEINAIRPDVKISQPSRHTSVPAKPDYDLRETWHVFCQRGRSRVNIRNFGLFKIHVIFAAIVFFFNSNLVVQVQELEKKTQKSLTSLRLTSDNRRNFVSHTKFSTYLFDFCTEWERHWRRYKWRRQK